MLIDVENQLMAPKGESGARMKKTFLPIMGIHIIYLRQRICWQNSVGRVGMYGIKVCIQ